jgi:hypothetical protein
MMPELHTPLEEEPCPIADQMLGDKYRASAHGLNELIATVSPTARALLAVYCYRRAHLASIGLAIAATCEEDDLISLGATLVPCCSNDREKSRSRRPLVPTQLADGKLHWRPWHLAN